jgi:hypothetical protein
MRIARESLVPQKRRLQDKDDEDDKPVKFRLIDVYEPKKSRESLLYGFSSISKRDHVDSRNTFNLNPFLPGCAFGALFVSGVHNSACSGRINMIPSAKWIYYVLLIHVACSIVQIRPLVAKLQQVNGLCGWWGS